MLYTQKTDDSAELFSNQKLKPSIEICEAVVNKIGSGKSKRYANSWSLKSYPGGFVAMGGANSDAFLRGQSIRDAAIDEEDSYELNIGQQGSPAALIKKRQVNFPDRKTARISTPVLEELSTIKPAFDAGSQERYYLPCPHCNPSGDHGGYMFVLTWENIRYSDELSETGYPRKVWAECPNCAGEIIESQHKTWMLDTGDWFSEKGQDPMMPVPRYKVGDVENPSFHISSFYSPVGFFSWNDAVAEWFDYVRTKDPALLQVFINQTCGDTFTLVGHDLSYASVQSRCENYAGNLGAFDVPNGALVLTAGADVQDDRIEVEVVGWGIMEENWSIDYVVIPGDTALMGDKYGMLPDGQPSVWRLLDDYLSRRWRHECGVEMIVEVTMIDCGHKTEEVHTFCRSREHRRIYPIKGVAGWGKGFYLNTKKRHERFGTHSYFAHTDELKTKVYAQLSLTDRGPGYCHFPKKPVYSEKYFKGLTCESRKVKTVGGRKKLYWDTPSGARNEPLDVRCYSYVGLLAYPIDLASRASMGLQRVFPPDGTASGIIRRKRKGSPGL
jgi:phage terminase large subunit GpA-like protein